MQTNFQFQVRVDDDDHPASDDLIDRVFIVGTNVAPSENYTSRRTYAGIYNNVQMDMSYRVLCNANYYGPTCTMYCVGRDDDYGHYECNSDGERTCRSGWTDLSNDCITRKLVLNVTLFSSDECNMMISKNFIHTPSALIAY